MSKNIQKEATLNKIEDNESYKEVIASEKQNKSQKEINKEPEEGIRKEDNQSKENMQNETEDKSLQISEKQELAVRKEELEEIKKEIKNQTTIPKEKKNEIYTKIFENIICAIVILIYFILINIGYKSIKPEIFIIDLKVFSMSLILATICIFEYAYKKESGKYTIKGIELMIVAIATLSMLHIYQIYNNKFVNIETIVALLFSVYYVVKTIVIYIKNKKEIKQQVNNIYKTARRNEGK